MTLARLIEAVEAGTLHQMPYGGMPMATACYPRDENGRLLPDTGGWSDADCLRAYHGSLDAAKRLHDALLPGWAVELWAWADDDADARVYRTHTDKEPEETYSFRAEVDGCNPARAWLLAVLRAMEGQKQ